MKRILLAAIAVLFAPLAFAECDQVLTMQVAEHGKLKGESVIKYFGLAEAYATDISKRGNSVVAEVWKQADKNGDYAVTLNETKTCDGKETKSPEVSVTGVTEQGVVKILKAGSKVGLSLIKTAEDQHAKGKKVAWGK